MNEEQKHANFKRIAERRTSEILNKIESLQAIAQNPSFYKYNESEIKAIFKAIDEELERTKKAFKKPRKKSKSNFTL